MHTNPPIHRIQCLLQIPLHCTALLLAGGALAPLASAQAQAPAVAVANTPYAIGAQRKGASKCINRVNQVTSFVTTNTSNSGLVINAPGAEANQKLLASVIEAVDASGNTSFVSTSFAPGSGPADCSATYDAVTYWPAACSVVASRNFDKFKPAQPLYKNINTLDGGPLAKVYLMPAGAGGCVSIKKEVLY